MEWSWSKGRHSVEEPDRKKTAPSEQVGLDTLGTLDLDIEKRFETLMEALPVGVFQANEAGAFVYVNEAWILLTDVSFVSSLQDGWLRAVHPLDRDYISEIWRLGIKSNAEFSFDCRILTSNNKTVWTSWHVNILHNKNGENAGFTGIVHDISDRKKFESLLVAAREEAVKGSESKSSFLAYMSHEIRTPLNTVIGMTGLLKKTQLNEEQRDCVQAIVASAESLMAMLNDTLDLAKVEANKLDLEQANFNLRHWVSESVEMFRLSAQTKGLRFDINIEIDENLETQGDAPRLRQIMSNFLSNAVRFTDKGYIQVKATALVSMTSKDQMKFYFEVSDSGVGIADGVRDHIFQPFSQAEAVTNRKYGGTGLGLSICKGLVEKMQGEIGFESKDGHGAKFWFQVPMKRVVDRAQEESAPKDDLKGLKNQKSQKILVVDDNPINQKVAIKMLQKIGHTADAADSGAQALQLLENSSYDLVMMDCQMPEMDGYETTKRIRHHAKPQLRDIPIIAITANAIKGDREKCLQCGMNDYVSKPLTMETLQIAINNSCVKQGGYYDCH